MGKVKETIPENGEAFGKAWFDNFLLIRGCGRALNNIKGLIAQRKT